MAISERVEALKRRFTEFDNWEDRYKHVIFLGKQLKPMDVGTKTDDLLVKGCQSQVWLHAQLDTDGLIRFSGDSDALIVKGLVSLLLEVYSGSTPSEVLSTSSEFLKEIGLAENLTPSRTNGLFSMVKQIQFYGLAFKSIADRK